MTLMCCICRQDIDVQENGWAKGHNAEPAKKGRCCTECNTNIVIPLRIMWMLHAQKREGKTID